MAYTIPTNDPLASRFGGEQASRIRTRAAAWPLRFSAQVRKFEQQEPSALEVIAELHRLERAGRSGDLFYYGRKFWRGDAA